MAIVGAVSATMADEMRAKQEPSPLSGIFKCCCLVEYAKFALMCSSNYRQRYYRECLVMYIFKIKLI